jgi:hypothetical protein
MSRRHIFSIGLALLVSGSMVQAEFVGGRTIPDARDAGLQLRAGQITSIKASVSDVGVRSGQIREDFSLNDLGVDGSYATFGLTADKAWRFVTLMVDAIYLGIDADQVAQRSYAIGLDGIDLGGDYDYLQVDANTSIHVEFTGARIEVDGLITPFSITAGEDFSFSPWISLGAYALAGAYDLDNGEVRGTVQVGGFSQSFASAGGTASGPAGFVLPEIGLGGELRFGNPDAFNLVINGNVAVLPWTPSTSMFLELGDNISDLEMDHTNVKVNGYLEFPREGGRAWTLGVQFQQVDTSASALLDNGAYVKDIDIKMTSVTGSLGLRF